jgi:hypothetical protein
MLASLLDHTFLKREARHYVDATCSPRLKEVIEEAHLGGFTVSSDFARSHAVHVAEASTRGFISSYDPVTGDYCRVWHVTEHGLRFMRVYV